MKTSLVLFFNAVFLASCASDASLDFRGVDPDLIVPPTQVMVLGTTHLSAYSDDLSLEDLEPLLERLEVYAPDIITIEGSSGMTCNRVRAYPLEHPGYRCFDGEPYRTESGLSVSEGSFQARKMLLEWPDLPTAAQRRTLAAAFLASEEPVSALVQWFRLDEQERVSGNGLGSASVAFFEEYGQSLNESISIAARLAARRGLEQVYYADDRGSYYFAEGAREAYGARVSELWPGKDDPCQAHFKSTDAQLLGGDLVGAYRKLNEVEYQRTQISCDWKRTMNDAEPEKYGRIYTLGWQARNLRMVSMIVTAAIDEPGGKVLSIVGASHKPYFEAYLNQMHDIEVVSTDKILH